MTYSIGEFAKLSGVSERTLRYYHERGLLHPQIDANGYRRFSSADADRLQLIRFYTALEFPLAKVASLLSAKPAERIASLRQQRTALAARQAKLARLLTQVDRTLANQEGQSMTDTEKFAAFKQGALRRNDADFGAEVTAKYGDDAKRESDQHFAGLSEADYQRIQDAETALVNDLQQALASDGAPSAAQLTQIYQDHRAWLQVMWPQYTPAMHRNLMTMYEADSRFADYYNNKVGNPDAAALLIKAVRANTPVE